MKNFLILVAAVATMFFSSCKKEKCVEPIKPPVIVDTTTIVKTVTYLLNGNSDTIAKISCNNSTCDTLWFQPSNQGLNGCWGGYSETPYGFSSTSNLVVLFKGQNKLHKVFVGLSGEIKKDQNGDFPYEISELNDSLLNQPAVRQVLVNEMNRTGLNFAVADPYLIGGSITSYTQSFLCR